MTHESYSSRNSISTPFGLIENTLGQNKSCFQKSNELVPNGNLWSSPYFRLDLACTNRPQKTRAYSERIFSLEDDRNSQSQQVSLPTTQQRQVEPECGSRGFREQVIRSTTSGALAKAQSLPERHVPPLSSALRNSERAQSGSKLRRLSPLREFSGDIHRSAEIEQESLGK